MIGDVANLECRVDSAGDEFLDVGGFAFEAGGIAAHEIQREILENYYFVPVFRHAVSAGIGPRIAAEKWQDVFPTVTTAYAYPWEDIKLKS